MTARLSCIQDRARSLDRAYRRTNHQLTQWIFLLRRTAPLFRQHRHELAVTVQSKYLALEFPLVRANLTNGVYGATRHPHGSVGRDGISFLNFPGRLLRTVGAE